MNNGPSNSSYQHRMLILRGRGEGRGGPRKEAKEDRLVQRRKSELAESVKAAAAVTCDTGDKQARSSHVGHFL